MGYAEVKTINSDFQNEPLNYLQYIDNIEKYGDASYVFKQADVPKKIFRELISKSTLLFTHDTIYKTLIKNLKSDDLYYFFKNHKKLGECLNMLLGVNAFSSGDFNSVCEYMNMTAIRDLNDEFLHAFSLVVEEILKSDNALPWIKDRFGVDLSSYSTLSEAILSAEGWEAMLKSGPCMACLSTTQWFNKEVFQDQYKRIWRTSNSDYYDDNGTHYTSEGTADGADISTDALKVMKDNHLVTEDRLALMDSAHKRLKDALYWFAQNESVSALKNYRELLEIFVSDEQCCQYLADYPDVLTDCLEDLEFANQIFGSSLAFNKIASSHDATEALVNFIANIQVSYDCLNTIKSSLALIPQNSSRIYNSEPLRDKVNATLDDVNKTMTDITACQKFNNTTHDLINTYTSDENFASRLFSNTNFVTWCTENATFVNNFVSNRTMITVLCTNATTMQIACRSTTFCNAMSASSVAMNAVATSSVAMAAVIANTNALNTVVASSVAMNAVAASSVAMNAVAASSVAMAAVIANTNALNTVVASSVAMNAIAASSVAMNAVATSSVARTALYNSASVVEPILAKSPTALNALKNTSSQVATVSTDSYVGMDSMYDGKAFVLEVWNARSDGGAIQNHGVYIIGNNLLTCDCSVTHTQVNKFASHVAAYNNLSEYYISYALIFKI